MSIALYMDQHVARAITQGLRARDVDVLTAYEDGASRLSDPDLLDRATILRRVIFTQDDDFLMEASLRQLNNVHFCGVIYAHQLRVSVGSCINQLEVIAKAGDLDDLTNHVEYLKP